MAALKWDVVGEHFYETGVSKGVLYPVSSDGTYPKGVAWSGLSKVSESPSGAEETKLYADNVKYLSLFSTEEYGSTIECYTYPVEFEECDGSASLGKGITIGQQTRKGFGFSYQTKKGNDTVGEDYGYVIYCVYGAKASPSSKDHETVNDSPAAATMSYEITTTPVDVTGYKPTACVKIDSTLVDAEELKSFEETIYGSASKEARLPLPDEIIEMFPKSVAALSVGTSDEE